MRLIYFRHFQGYSCVEKSVVTPPVFRIHYNNNNECSPYPEFPVITVIAITAGIEGRRRAFPRRFFFFYTRKGKKNMPDGERADSMFEF